jgi:hypothetical protein
MMKLCIKFGKNYFGYSFGYFSQTHPVTLSTTFRSIPEKKHNLVTSPGLPDFLGTTYQKGKNHTK